MLLGDPGSVSTGCSQGTPKAIPSSGRIAPNMAWVGSMSIGWQVLVKLVDVEGLHVGHHFMADLPDVHVAKVDVGFSSFPQGTPLPLGVSLTRLQFCLWSGWRGGGSMALTCEVKNTQRWKGIHELPLHLPCSRGTGIEFLDQRFSLQLIERLGSCLQ